MLLHRHRVKTFLNEGSEKDWTCWYSNTPNTEGRNIEVQTQEFSEDQVQRICSSKELGTLYKQNPK